MPFKNMYINKESTAMNMKQKMIYLFSFSLKEKEKSRGKLFFHAAKHARETKTK
jgi:hypothetical protein